MAAAALPAALSSASHAAATPGRAEGHALRPLEHGWREGATGEGQHARPTEARRPLRQWGEGRAAWRCRPTLELPHGARRDGWGGWVQLASERLQDRGEGSRRHARSGSARAAPLPRSEGGEEARARAHRRRLGRARGRPVYGVQQESSRGQPHGAHRRRPSNARRRCHTALTPSASLSGVLQEGGASSHERRKCKTLRLSAHKSSLGSCTTHPLVVFKMVS
jgi:hypothetical protein